MARFAAALRALENGALALLAALLVVLAGGQIVARLVFSGGWTEVDGALRALVLWIALLGAMVAARERKHLAIDAISRYARGGWARLLNLVTQLAAAVLCGMVAWTALRLVLDERAAGTIAFAEVPSWWVQALLPFAFGVMALRFAWAAVAPPPERPTA